MTAVLHTTHDVPVGTDRPVFDEGELVRYLRESRGYLTVHRPVMDGFGTIVDARLEWWNDSYGRVRATSPVPGESFFSIASEGVASSSAMNEAWRNGHSVQCFEFVPAHAASFRIPVLGKQVWMEWTRVGEVLVRHVLDLDEMEVINSFYTDKNSLIAHAARMRAVAVERERIARNLHDTVIQNLYATALSLSLAGSSVEGEVERVFNEAIDSIGNVIAQIRREILDCETRQASPLRLQIESVVLPILTPTRAECEVEVSVRTVPDHVLAHVRAVCSEAVSNAVRHGGASIVRISLDLRDGRYRLTIEDNGSGIPDDAIPHNGLKNMRDRAEQLGGRMTTRQRALGGTAITWTVPVGGESR